MMKSESSTIAYEKVPIIARAGLSVQIPSAQSIQGYSVVSHKLLRNFHAVCVTPRSSWVRFVGFRASAEDFTVMYPRVLRNGILLVDRHYNSVRPYRRGWTDMHVVLKKEGSILVREVELHGQQLILRPQRREEALQFIKIRPRQSYGEFLLGRVCHIEGEP